ncbi:hypothetical protein AVEN_44405-1 [Araneus ventricosus]|uniref:Uncharacterized protein n=1 Tax=Araneus ventricosus TaxID=182803 RepID=A0A4Y2IMT7_ARAVE|nr:hypothetical protein AVEN_44405-1 [Araneus ventricosus]
MDFAIRINPPRNGLRKKKVNVFPWLSPSPDLKPHRHMDLAMRINLPRNGLRKKKIKCFPMAKSKSRLETPEKTFEIHYAAKFMLIIQFSSDNGLELVTVKE